MTRDEIARLVETLSKNPTLAVSDHPNPEGNGPRRFLRYDKTRRELVFDRPDKGATSYLPVTDDLATAPDGFTIMGGRVTYRFVTEESDAVF